MPEVLLEAKNLKKYFKTKKGWLHAVDDVNFCINKGETLGLVGESGCGKSTVGRVILRLLEATAGQVLFNGENILEFNKRQIREFRENAQIVFQDPFASLNPRMSVSEIIAEPLIVNKKDMSRAQRYQKVKELMELTQTIEGLDSELDRVVFELYGLTEDERAIIS